MKDFSKLITSVIACELVGLAGTPFTLSAIPTWYETLDKPFFAPPNWLFGPVWTLLYLLMGVSFYLIWKEDLDTKKHKAAAHIFFIQLMLNFFWSPVFFGLKSPELALVIIVAMWLAIAVTIKKFYAISKLAAYLLVPYILWVTFATALNGAIAVLN